MEVLIFLGVVILIMIATVAFGELPNKISNDTGKEVDSSHDDFDPTSNSLIDRFYVGNIHHDDD